MADAAAAAAASDIDAREAAERLQGERFHALSQRCHEQNWAQVHALAEEIVFYKRPQLQPKIEVKDDDSLTGAKKGEEITKSEKKEMDMDEDDDGPKSPLPDRTIRDGAVSTSGEVMSVDGAATGGSGRDDDVLQELDAGGNKTGENNSSQTTAGNANAKPSNVAPTPVKSSLALASTPRMLSTCLGTASPLAWTCRYSAPSATVKLVLDLDLSAVRRCLPQLGTPLHECVGRPRPLHKMPHRKGRWSGVLGKDDGAGGTGESSKPRKKDKKSKKKKKKRGSRTPRVLAGMREWRRTVRALIAADETLLKEDTRYAAQKALEDAAREGEEAKSNPEEWRRTVHTMIRENVTNINRLKNPSESQRSSEAQHERSMSDSAVPMQQERFAPVVRATLAQDADGNTPLHFMIRGAASPINSGRFHSRVEEDYDDEDEDADDDDEENKEEGKQEGEMDVDSSAGEEAPQEVVASAAPRAGNLRRYPHYGAAGGSWDGIRWCMEAHLRRVERRVARRKMSWQESKMDEVRGSHEDDGHESDGARGVARGVASVTIGSPMPSRPRAEEGDEEAAETEDAFGFSPKLPAKRKSLEFHGGETKSSRRGSSSLSLGSSFLHHASDDDLNASASSGGYGHHKSGRQKGTAGKYLDDDERQDCCYDPLLGAVRDLVHACPEAAGVPDHREYEETPLIVALKSSIYVVMEPQMMDGDHFQLGGGAGVGLAMLQQVQAGGAPPAGGGGNQGGNAAGGGGDGLAVFGGAGVGGGPVLNGLALGIGGGMGGFGGGFPFPELGALIHQNRPFNFFPDDEAMMAVLRGHGRRVTRPRRRRGPNSAAHAAANAPNGGGLRLDGQNEGEGVNFDDDDSSVSDSPSLPDDECDVDDEDPRHDAFVPSANERVLAPYGIDPPGVQLGLLPRRRPRYDYQTALEYRIFMLVRIMLDAYPRAACLMISDYTPLHSAVFHGRCPDTIRLLLDAEERFRSESDARHRSRSPSPSSILSTPLPNPEPCPTLSGPAMLCTNTRGELPLHFACMRNESARTIRLLAEADPRAALVRDASGRTPLRWLWIRFVDGLLDRFGGRDTRMEEDDARRDGEADPPAFSEQEEGHATGNFPNPGQSVLGGAASRVGRQWLSMNDAFSSSGRASQGIAQAGGAFPDDGGMFVFDTEYIRRTRNIDRTVDFLRMRHIPSFFENIEYVAAEHAITVLLKLKYLQQRRSRQLEAYDASRAAAGSSGGSSRLPPDVSMSTKEEFILYAFEKFTALIYAVLVASDAEERRIAPVGNGMPNIEAMGSDVSDSRGNTPLRKKLWRSLLAQEEDDDFSSKKQFFLVHEACGASRASCPAAVAKICLCLHSDQLFRRDDKGRLPLHRVALRGIGWEPPGSESENNGRVSLADETLTLLKEVLAESHESASSTYDDNRQLPLHCMVESLVKSLVMGKRRRASLRAEARVTLQKYRHTHVEIAMECLSELLGANSSALQQRDGKTGLFPFMQAATPHVNGCAVVKYTSDLSRRPGYDVGVGYHSMDTEVVEEDDIEAESDHVTIIYYLLREDPSVISGL